VAWEKGKGPFPAAVKGEDYEDRRIFVSGEEKEEPAC